MPRRTNVRKSKQNRLEQLERRELLAADLGMFQHNSAEPLDVNADAFVSPLDALDVINELNFVSDRGAGGSTDRAARRERFFDVNNDRALTPLDALMVINGINERGRRGGGGPKRGGEGPNNPPPNDPPPPPAPETPAEVASLDGSGNNLEHPEWGTVGSALERWSDPEYADGLSALGGEDLLSAREVSNIVNASPGDIENEDGLSDLTWLFGQFIDHDITLRAAGETTEAADIAVPTGDPFFDPFATGEATIGFERSDYELDSDSIRQQVNTISAYLDGSVIYGSDAERAADLRTFEGGLLKTSEGDLLPFNEAGIDNEGGDSETLFLAGDVRANENAALAAMHTVWVREHNRIASKIAAENPDLDDEEVFQQARRRVVAELQSITYNEFLPALLGNDAIPEYAGYDSNVNPNISNVFATAAYRFGHTMLSSELLRLNPDGTQADEGNLSLQDAFFNTAALTENGIDSILLGASVQSAQEIDPFLVDDVRNFLFGPPGSGGFDLAALNIQRGRDHGLADYNQIRIDMGLEPVDSFDDISSDPDVQARLEDAYGDVNSIDAWVGMLAEDHLEGSSLGPTASAVIAQQFAAIRDGDRFYYENTFSGRELRDIQKTTLADVIERNTEIDFARGQNVFFAEPVKTRGQDRADTIDQLARDQATPPIQSPAAMNDRALDELMNPRRPMRGV